MATKIQASDFESTQRNKNKRKSELIPYILIPLIFAALSVAIYFAVRSGNEDNNTLGTNSTAAPNATVAPDNTTTPAPPVYPEVLVQCPWFPDYEIGDEALPIFVLDVRDIPAYDPAEPLTLSLWIEQEDPIYPYRYFFNSSSGPGGPGPELEPGGELMAAEDSSGSFLGSDSSSGSGSDSSGIPTDLSPEDLYAALEALDPFYYNEDDRGPLGQYLFTSVYRDSLATLRRSDFWPGLNLSDVPGEEGEPESVPDMYTRKVVQAQHEKDFLYAQLTLPLFGVPGWGELNAQFMRIDGGEANLKLLRNQSEDPDLYSLPLGGPGLFMASYVFAGAPLSMFTPSCSFWIYVVDSGPEVSIPETCTDGFPLQEWDIESESGAPEQVAWCNCFDTCGGWNGGAFCENYSLDVSANVYDLLNCGENNIKEVNLTLLDGDLVLDALQTVFHGVCLPPEYTAEMVQDLRDGYEVTALFELQRAADPALNETEAVVFATPQMEVSDYVFHAFDENVVETPWGEVAQLLSNMSVGAGEAYSYDWEIHVVVHVATEGDYFKATCRILIPEPYCNPELDADGDLANDCIDECADDSNKTNSGECGCGEPDIDTDGDKTADCVDACPADPQKDSSSGVCGCGVSDTDTDGDGVANCNDVCDRDPLKITSSGICGCGFPDTDTDGDSSADCADVCPDDPAKSSSSGVCGCGVSDDEDLDSDGVPDCPESCSSETRPNITSIFPEFGVAGTTITLTGSWPLAVPGAKLWVRAWFNGSLSVETNDIVVASANPTTITFEAPGWSFPLLSDREVQFTVLVLPADTPSSGYPTTCSSTAGQSPSLWDTGDFATYTYKTFAVRP